MTLRPYKLQLVSWLLMLTRWISTLAVRAEQAFASVPLPFHALTRPPRLPALPSGPQPIAKRGGYGAFLLEDRDLVLRIVHALAHDPSISVPVCAKIRVLDDRDATVELAIAIAEAGAAMLTVHGRTRMEKKQDCRHADWDTIARIRAALPHVPVLANGGIHHAYDFARCMATTGVEGVLSSEAALESPGMWSGGIHWPTGRVHTQLEMAHRYIQVSFQLHTLYATVRSHTLKILQGALTEHVDLRDRAVDIGVQFEGLHAVVQELASRFGVALPGLHDPAPVGRALDPSKLLQFRTVSGEATIEPTNAQAWLAEHSSMGDVGSDAITQCHAIWRTLCPQAAAFCLTGPGKPATPGHAPDYSQAIGPAFRGGHLAGAWIGDRLVLHKGTVAAPHMKHVMKSARRAFKRHHVNTRILEEMRISVEPEVPAIPQPVPVPAGTRCVLPPVAPRAGDAAPSTPDQQATLLHMTSGPPHQQAAWLATWAPPLQFPQAGRWYWRHHKHVLAGEMEASREHTW